MISSLYSFFKNDVISLKTNLALDKANEASISVKSSDGVTTFPCLINGYRDALHFPLNQSNESRIS